MLWAALICRYKWKILLLCQFICMWGECVKDRGQLWGIGVTLTFSWGDTCQEKFRCKYLYTSLHKQDCAYLGVFKSYPFFLHLPPFPCSHFCLHLCHFPPFTSEYPFICFWLIYQNKYNYMGLWQKWAPTSFTILWVCSAPLTSSYSHEYRGNGSSQGCESPSSAWAFMVFLIPTTIRRDARAMR